MVNTNSLNNKPDSNRTAKAITIYGASGSLTEIGPLTDGQLCIGNTADPPTAGVLTSAGGTITITNGAGTVDLKSTALVAGNSGFLAYRSSAIANATGGGTEVNFSCSNEIFDIAGDYNNGTYTFTAPATGKYYFSATCYSPGQDNSHTLLFQKLNTSNRTYYFCVIKSGPNREVPTGAYSGTGGDITDMDSADTATATLVVSGGGKVVAVGGDATDFATYFSGMRIF